jgi:hypothetical protein
VGTPSKDYWLSSGQVASDYSFQGDLVFNSTPNVGPGYIYRAQDASNGYSIELDGSQLKVIKTVGGGATIVFSKAYAAVTGQKYTIKIVPEANGFSVYVNQLKQATITESAWTAGKYGVMNRGQNNVSFSNMIKEKVSNPVLGKISGVVLVGSTLEYAVTYEDPEGDPRITQGETWGYTHNPDVFLNPLGVMTNISQMTSPITTFTLPGEYTFKFKTKDDPQPSYLYPSSVFASYRQESNVAEGTIRVHRPPIAQFTATADSIGRIAYVNTSYDPDRYNNATGAYSTETTGINYALNHGILIERWRYKLADSSSYTMEKLTKATASGTYVLELAVQDEYGAWSEWAMQTVTLTATPIKPPLAGFVLDKLWAYRNVAFQISSTANDPQDGARENLAHAYYISNQSTNGIESLQSASRTDWTKVFNSMGIFKLRQVVTNSYGLTAEQSQLLSILNRKPVTTVITPASTDQNNPITFSVLKPQFAWTYSDADGDTQSKYNYQIYKLTGDLVLEGTANSSVKTMTPASNLPENEVMFIRVQTFDGYEWGDWSGMKYFKVVTNRPPTADFDWSPHLAYEGDAITLTNQSSDPDGDTLTYAWSITGAYASNVTAKDVLIPGAITANRPGTYTVKLTVQDPTGAMAMVTKSFTVLPLGIQGFVKHTNAWEANRLAYNASHPSTPRPADWFWAGEAFVLEATVTDTGTSATRPVSVKAVASPELQMGLSVVSPQDPPTHWSSLLREADTGITFEELAQQSYSFVFTVTYSNGLTKTSTVPIRIEDTVDSYAGVQRIH